MMLGIGRIAGYEARLNKCFPMNQREFSGSEGGSASLLFVSLFQGALPS